jgi:hypothetical protein
LKKARTIASAIPGLGGFLASACLWMLTGSILAERPFSFKRDTFAFANEPGYADLRAFSRDRAEVVRRSIGLGWPTYFRPGNWRILLPHGPTQQARTHMQVEHALAQGEFFIAYLTTFPENLDINHGVLVYARQKISGHRNHADRLRYRAYDPNHADAPRTLEWSQRDSCFLYQRDWDFVGGRVVVWQVYGRPLQ